MRIVNLKTFRSMPAGTVFCKYQPQIFDNLCIKGETWDADFIAAELTGWPESNGSADMSDKLSRYEQTGESFKLELDCYGRDGLFDDNQLFAIYEKDDLQQLISVLQKQLDLL